MKRVFFLLIGMFIIGYACNDDDYIHEETSPAATIEESVPDSTAQEPDTTEAPPAVSPVEPVTVPAGLSNVYLLGQAVKAIEFENEYVWAATDSFLVRLDRLNNTITYYSYPYMDKNGSSYKLKIDKNGLKWIARSEYLQHGNSIYESYSSSIYSFNENQWTKIKSFGYGEISSLALDKNNNKWIAKLGNNGLYVVEQERCVQYTPENSGLVYNYVAQVASDKEGNIWVANYGNLGGLISADLALMKYDGNTWISHFSVKGTYLLYMSIDSHGNPWIQQLAVVYKLDMASNSWAEQITMDWPSYLHLHAIDNEDRCWFISRDKGIAVYDGSDWHNYTTSNSEMPSNKVYQIKFDSDGTKWIGTANGLARLETLP
ncbi:MAG: hypothetical protein AB7U05_03750 [Mangrovibacterium sp.]